MTLYLIRHAQAGSRATWSGSHDQLRPLTGAGRHQSSDLVGTLAEVGIQRVVSSPYTRCAETVAPLAARLGLPLEIDDAFAEGPSDNALAFVRGIGTMHVAICSHGDIIPELLSTFAADDGVDLGPDPRCQKGSVWILEPHLESSRETDKRDGGLTRFVSASYVAPPR